jgi:hypothetical protein
MLGDINFQRLVQRLKILLFQRLLPQRKSQASPGEVLRAASPSTQPRNKAEGKNGEIQN